MNRRTESNYKRQLDFAYAQVDYWKNVALAHKKELEYYKGIVDYLVEEDIIELNKKED